MYVFIILLFAILFASCNTHKNEEVSASEKEQLSEQVIEEEKSDVEIEMKVYVEVEENSDNEASGAESVTEEESEVIASEEFQPVFQLSDEERLVAECIVMGEANGEPYDGQVLVAQCLLNACLKDDLQPSEVRTKYKYSGWNENPSESVKNAVNAVFDDGYKVTDEFILYFYAPKHSKGTWHETQRFVIEVGGHRFFAEWD